MCCKDSGGRGWGGTRASCRCCAFRRGGPYSLGLRLSDVHLGCHGGRVVRPDVINRSGTGVRVGQIALGRHLVVALVVVFGIRLSRDRGGGGGGPDSRRDGDVLRGGLRQLPGIAGIDVARDTTEESVVGDNLGEVRHGQGPDDVDGLASVPVERVAKGSGQGHIGRGVEGGADDFEHALDDALVKHSISRERGKEAMHAINDALVDAAGRRGHIVKRSVHRRLGTRAILALVARRQNVVGVVCAILQRAAAQRLVEARQHLVESAIRPGAGLEHSRLGQRVTAEDRVLRRGRRGVDGTAFVGRRHRQHVCGKLVVVVPHRLRDRLPRPNSA
eukprot:m.48429 g.48429  ORF g.48429 m.48429 type:complete len:332 (-) comp6033_c0_seq1:2572-3567(-)